MKARVLIVCEDPASFATQVAALDDICQVEIVAGAPAGRWALMRATPFAAIVVDASASQFDAIDLLVHARAMAPDRPRVVVVNPGERAGFETAAHLAQVFRVLTTPCSGPSLGQTVREALGAGASEVADARQEQNFHRLVSGFVLRLTVAEPEMFGFGERLQPRAREVGGALGLSSTRELEAAAMLLPIGFTALPLGLLAKRHARAGLDATEAAEMRRVPELGAQMLDNVPPLAGVAAFVRYQRKGFDGSGSPQDGVMGANLPLGARILRPLVDLLTLEDSGMMLPGAFKMLERDAAAYDPDILGVIRRFVPTWSERLRPDRLTASSIARDDPESASRALAGLPMRALDLADA